MAYITNDGARLIDRARTEGKSIVFGSVRMNTIYKSDPYSLVQQTDEWFGESHGSVVGCISHVSVNDVSEVCDSKLAILCNDFGESWKSLGIYARLNDEGGESEVLFACESIENGEYKDVTIVELPVTLAGVVEDFGLSEGGSGGGGGGVPANMMTTDTDQTGLSCTKEWTWENYIGEGNIVFPQEGDKRVHESFAIYNIAEGDIHVPLSMDSTESQYNSKEGWHRTVSRRLEIASDAVHFNGSFASWSDIIKAAKVEQGFDSAHVQQMGDGSFEIGGEGVKPNIEVKIGDYALFVIDSNSKIASVRATSGNVLDVSVAVFDSGSVHRVNGIVNDTAGISFDAPITLAAGQEIYIHWTRYANNI